ncbi:His Kinase A domain containing protein [Mortierella sp. AM989]|nr:His Kinase A domain containing protein [Mortierella sp. AM989]
MAAMPFTPHTISDDSRSDQSIQESSQRQGTFQHRPQFLRSITSPIPQRSIQSLETNSEAAGDATSRGHHTTMDYMSPRSAVSSMSSSTATPGSVSVGVPQEHSHLIRPQVQPLQKDQQQNDSQLRSFSTSILPSFLPTSSSSSINASSNTLKSSISETLKEHRWSKGLKLNWVPGFGGQSRSSLGLEGPVNASSTSSTRSSLSHQKSLRRRKSEGTSLRTSKTDRGIDSNIGGPGPGLAPISTSGKSFPRSGKTGLETSVDQLKVSETKTRQMPDSGLSTTSSKLSGAGLAERISGFAQTVRGLSRSPFSPGQSSPTMTTSSQCSAPTSPASSPQCLIDHGHGIDPNCQICNTSKCTPNRTYGSWDDFLDHYRQGQFPSDYPIDRPQLDTPFPPTPPYIEPSHEYLPFLAPPLPPDEENRLRALHSFQILQTGQDLNFERIAQLVAGVMGTAGCVITLVDHAHIQVKAQYPTSYGSCPREHSLCGHTILRASNDPMIILDTKADWRFRSLPGVMAELSVRFYAGAPLTTSDGFNIGSLCLIDFEPRKSFTERERLLLIDFAAVVMREMELWNDQVQLCIRNRMMRDVTRWVRGCLDIAKPELTTTDNPPIQDFGQGQPHSLDTIQMSLQTPSNMAGSSSVTLTSASVADMGERPALISSPVEPIFPTPSGSPTLLSCAFSPSSNGVSEPIPVTSGNPLKDKAFPAACIYIQATLNVDTVYLVQASANQTIIPPTGSSIVWNYLDAAGRPKGSVGVVKGAQIMNDTPNTALTCLASSKKDSGIYNRWVLDEKMQHARREGSAWICIDEGCRPHRLGDALINATEPVWDRDMPIIKEMLGYVRQEIPHPREIPGKGKLFIHSQDQEDTENDWFGANVAPSTLNGSRRRKLLCHTFQGTVQTLAAGAATPYQSSLIVPVMGPSSANNVTTDYEPWAYFVILTASHTKQFSFHERVYLRNFGSCLVTEVMKRRVEAADKAKGTFIKSISHELRTPLHIILGILELLYANPEEPLSDSQMAMVSSAEASGKTLIDTINNIIDLAKLDPDNDMEAQNIHGELTMTTSPEAEETIMEDIDIRDLCQKVAETLAKACTEKNIVVVPSWTKPSLSSLSSSSSNSAMGSTTNIISSNAELTQAIKEDLILSEDSINMYPSSTESLSDFTARKLRSERRTVLELIVAMDEPEKDIEQETIWNFSLDVKSMTRILTQLVENAIKFTTTGFVEISSVALPHGAVPMKSPYPDAHPILFTIRDTGKGISAEFVNSHLFKRFSQEDPLQVGTGLGLALVKELVKKLEGLMEVWSEGIEGKGCVVKVLVWASPAAHQTKSLKDVNGPWQDKSCRFYVGEPSVGADRLFKIMGERMMGQQCNMNVERGDEQDTSPEDMLKDLYDQSPCDLLVLNDDLVRLKAYLSHLVDYHHVANLEETEDLEAPVPLLMLTAPPHMKEVQELVNDYLETQIDSPVIRPASIVIMTKPIGPIKLLQCLRECFTPAFSSPHLQTPQGSPRLSVASISSRASPVPLIRSATAPHITTAALGVHDNRLLSAGTIIKQSFVFPMIHQGDHDQRLPMALIPPHSPGGLVLPPRVLNLGPSPATTPEYETCPTRRMSTNSIILREGYSSHPVTPHQRLGIQVNGSVSFAEFKANIDTTVPKLKPQRTIHSQKLNKTSIGTNATTATDTATAAASAAAMTISAITFIGPDGILHTDRSAPKRPPSRVLIVEDNITNRMILRTFLKKRGIDVVEAENGKLGVERFQEEVLRRGGKAGFDFVLMDLQMPIMDGNMATKQIREFEQNMIDQYGLSNLDISSQTTSKSDINDRAEDGADVNIDGVQTDQGGRGNGLEKGYHPTTIFALTGLAADEDKRLAFECGVDGYLTKPVSLKTLGALMSSCLPASTEGPTAA